MTKLGAKVPTRVAYLPDGGWGAGGVRRRLYSPDILTASSCCQGAWGTLEGPTEPRFQWIAAKHNIDKFDGTTVMMLLSFQPKKKCKIREVLHGGHLDQQFSAVRNCVHPVQ